jgi:FkbM family methyltransferase
VKRFVLSSLRSLGRVLPNIKYIRALPNVVFVPVAGLLAPPRNSERIDVGGFVMSLDRRQCVDQALYFAPQHYDRRFILEVQKRFPSSGGVFVDCGANIGYWSLVMAHTFTRSNIYSFEINPDTAEILKENVHLNRFDNISVINCGVSDQDAIVPLFLNLTGNRGGDSLVPVAGRSSIHVPVKKLLNLLGDLDIANIDAIKIDIEGYETKVFKSFYEEAPKDLWPITVCAEMSHSFGLDVYLCKIGYKKVMANNENALFVLR